MTWVRVHLGLGSLTLYNFHELVCILNVELSSWCDEPYENHKATHFSNCTWWPSHGVTLRIHFPCFFEREAFLYTAGNVVLRNNAYQKRCAYLLSKPFVYITAIFCITLGPYYGCSQYTKTATPIALLVAAVQPGESRIIQHWGGLDEESHWIFQREWKV